MKNKSQLAKLLFFTENIRSTRKSSTDCSFDVVNRVLTIPNI